MMLSYESLALSTSGGEGLWLLSDLLFLSLEPQVLDFSDNILAELLALSNFSLALPTGFCPEVVHDLEL